MKLYLIPVLLLSSLFFSEAYSQNDSLKINHHDFHRHNNPLPPGPSTISGTLVDQDGSPIQGARITVKYPDGKQREVDTFISNEWGIFSVYIFRYDQPYIDLEIKIGKKVCKTIRYDKPGRGINMGSSHQKIICKMKRNKKRKRE